MHLKMKKVWGWNESLQDRLKMHNPHDGNDFTSHMSFWQIDKSKVLPVILLFCHSNKHGMLWMPCRSENDPSLEEKDFYGNKSNQKHTQFALTIRANLDASWIGSFLRTRCYILWSKEDCDFGKFSSNYITPLLNIASSIKCHHVAQDCILYNFAITGKYCDAT